MMNIISIDIGILNLAIVEAEISYKEYEKLIIGIFKEDPEKGSKEIIKKGMIDLSLKKITNCHLIDIQSLVEFCNDKNCDLGHDKCPADYMSHLFKEFPIFETCDKILVERQPPGGLQCIQEIIHYVYRKKTVLVSPGGMHCFFKINRRSSRTKELEEFEDIEKGEYHFSSNESKEIFKKESYKNDYEYRKKCVVGIARDYLKEFKNFQNTERQHDLADALCLMIYWLSEENKKLAEEKMHSKVVLRSKYF